MNYSIYAESTPNPEVMKFVSNRMLADKSIEINSIQETQGITIAEELMKFPFMFKLIDRNMEDVFQNETFKNKRIKYKNANLGHCWSRKV